MAKGKYHKWLEADGLLMLQGWARDGLTDEQIAHNIGINVATLYDWKKLYPKISEALKRGKEVVDYAVENALLKKALGGDVTAMIFWLKNRKPYKWRDRFNLGLTEAKDDIADELERYFEQGQRETDSGILQE